MNRHDFDVKMKDSVDKTETFLDVLLISKGYELYYDRMIVYFYITDFYGRPVSDISRIDTILEYFSKKMEFVSFSFSLSCKHHNKTKDTLNQIVEFVGCFYKSTRADFIHLSIENSAYVTPCLRYDGVWVWQVSSFERPPLDNGLPMQYIPLTHARTKEGLLNLPQIENLQPIEQQATLLRQHRNYYFRELQLIRCHKCVCFVGSTDEWCNCHKTIQIMCLDYENFHIRER